MLVNDFGVIWSWVSTVAQNDPGTKHKEELFEVDI